MGLIKINYRCLTTIYSLGLESQLSAAPKFSVFPMSKAKVNEGANALG